MCSPPRCRRRLPASHVPESGGKSAALGNRDCPAAGSRRLETAAHALARRPVRAYPGGSRRPRGEPARPIPIGGSSSAVPCNKIFKTPSRQGGSKSSAWLRSSQKSHYCATFILAYQYYFTNGRVLYSTPRKPGLEFH